MINPSQLDLTYGLIDFDHFQNDEYLLQTAGHGRVHIRYTAHTPDVITAVPIEIISIPKQQA